VPTTHASDAEEAAVAWTPHPPDVGTIDAIPQVSSQVATRDPATAVVAANDVLANRSRVTPRRHIERAWR
jgi:hypothetical protein